MKYNKGIVSIKRRINTNHDKKLEEYLIDNCLYRNEVYNDFVDAVNTYENNGNNLFDFSPRHYATFYYNEIESHRQNYEYYTSGIRAKVASDIHDNIKIVIRDRFKNNDNSIILKHREYDPFFMTFAFENKREERRLFYSAKARVFSPYEVFITFNKQKVKYPILLKEKLLSDRTPILDKDGDLWYYDKQEKYLFREKDIKEIIFSYELNNFYISLIIHVKFNKNNKDKYAIGNAGIDLGIHNPVTVYDGIDFSIYKMDEKSLNKIQQLENRSKRLKEIMTMKYNENIKKVESGLLDSPYSKNYRKVQKKLRITTSKIHNIRKNWILQTCTKLVNEYDNIVVDSFEQPKNGHSYTEKMKKMNYDNRNHSMYEFNKTLEHMSAKYYCNYIESPPYTTRTCCICGFKNEKLKLSERYLKCKNCGAEIDRDLNAAKNCFKYIDE